MLTTLLSFAIVLIVLILAHELGHFVTAKLFKIRVEEFGLGYPPRLFGIRRGETVYSLNAIPLGGFTKMLGEEDPQKPGSLASKSTGKRLLVLVAGSMMNALLPLLLFSMALMVPHNVLAGQVVIKAVSPNSPAATSGIVAEDIILEIAGRPVANLADAQRAIQLNLGKPITMLIEGSDVSRRQVKVVPRWKPPENEGAVGVLLQINNGTIVRESQPFWKAIPMGVVDCIETFVLFKNGIIMVIIGSAPATIGGPVAIAQITGEAARAGISPLLEFAAFLSINLAIINILPLPALDGGRIAFVLLEWARRGKRISPRTEGLVHLIGFITLLSLILLITLQDIIRIISGDSLLP